METTAFFNLPDATLGNGHGEKTPFVATAAQYNVSTHWRTTEVQSLNKKSLFDCFAGTIPVIRQKDFLSQDECAKMVEVLKSHKIVSSIQRLASMILRTD